MEMTALWVDDLRPPPAGWHWATTSTTAIEMLGRRPYDVMSLDHDLGDDDTTRPVVRWLCEHPDQWPAEIRIHTANPVGREYLAGMVNRYHHTAGRP